MGDSRLLNIIDNNSKVSRIGIKFFNVEALKELKSEFGKHDEPILLEVSAKKGNRKNMDVILQPQ